MFNELNLYYCAHDDFLALRIGEILEEMGIFKFTPSVRQSMNLYGALQGRSKEILSWYRSNCAAGGRINVVIFLTRFFKGREDHSHEFRLLKMLFKDRRVNIYTIIDEEMRKSIDYLNEDYNWLFTYSCVFHVSDSCIIADTVDVARSLATELIRQRCDTDSVFLKDPFSAAEFRKEFRNVYIDSIINAYHEIPDDDLPSKFLLVFSVYKYVENNTGRSDYGKCMEYLLKRSVKELMMTEGDLELSNACLFSEMRIFDGKCRLSTIF